MSDSIGQRNTQQREAIVDAIKGAPGPLTVEEILAVAQGRVANMGIATVYRTVKLLLESNTIQAVVLPDGQSRYEAADLGHHHHFRCRVCEKVYDLDVCPVALPKKMNLPDGFEVEDHELTLYGVCPGCKP